MWDSFRCRVYVRCHLSKTPQNPPQHGARDDLAAGFEAGLNFGVPKALQQDANLSQFCGGLESWA